MSQQEGWSPQIVDEPADVLVVCHANITRSPLFAAMLAERFASADVRFASAGVRAMVGSPADPGSVVEAEVRGLSLVGHRARQLTADMLADSRLVITMTESQRADCRRLLPESTPQAFTLPEAVRLARHAGASLDGGLECASAWHAARPMAPAPSVREDVADPHGGPLEGYVRLAMELDRYLAWLTAPA